MSRYDGKKVVITGGSSGLGLVTAKLFVDEGARVLITGRTQATLDSAGEHLGPSAVTVRSDAASLSDIAALADRVSTEFGAVDALFANAGISLFAPLEEMTEQMYDEVFSVNAKGPYFTVQRLAPLVKAGGGIVLTTSIVDEMGMALTSAYSATKAALRSMTRTLARELVPQGVRVNAVSPGPIDTGILEASLPPDVAEQTRAQLTADNPMLRYGESMEVARAVAFLAFDATYTTGAELPVDGGRSQL
ncbi:SDR family oxidoreductase [Mycolicibacterium litorale]|uniref:Short-chain dehydrogenase n=1 Tax=Mycolicibacterium litorale TaxID=758802 RepID=A0AAD1MSR8_9MYCO|nr:SDR family oxidoreductase [Mycolicibacterium litorale]MCV7418625.1 SDR family oxidoreductase [Mycolicibacterium litorale]TDY05977.1 NAD(P)-dependent dehydrogenase (short-subunit alcohol dehydrogenase family) [Mycolicibacterium litorale]BBY14517.1 short-chain dehydrogenase [Mycolicibacterium litorale]